MEYVQLTWDGSALPPAPESIILDKYTEGRRTFLTLETTDGELVVRATTAKRIFCLMDEFKEYFGLKKTGSHTIKIGRRNYTIYRHSWEETKDVTLEEKQRLILFRVLMGAYSTYESLFYYREKDLLVNDHEPKPFRLNLSARMIREWFAPQEKNKDRLLDILHQRCREFLGKKDLSSLRSDLQKIVRRVDSQLCAIPLMLVRTWDAALRA